MQCAHGTSRAKMLGVPMAKKRRVEIDHDEIVRRFAQQLRSVRTSCGMSQADLASKAEITPTYVSRLESAKVAPGIDLVAKLAGALGVTPGDLLPVGEEPDQLPLLKEQAQD